MAEEQDQLPTKASPSVPSQPQRTPEENTAVGAILSRLALHYWRPDFTPMQAKLLVQDYLADLGAFTPEQINQACAEYRRNGENKFFPTSGQLLKLLASGSSHCRLPTYRAPAALEAPRATKSVAQVLKEHGFDREGTAWEERA